jgi:ABC-2 type transport system permease protein
MKDFTAFFRKELTEIIRTGKFIFIMLSFTLLGILNPLIAKLKPFIYEKMSESLSESGVELKAAKVTAVDSWIQFYKNLPVALIIIILMFSGLFASEYVKGTLIPFVTKGVSKTGVFIAKASSVLAVWTVGYWSCWVMTYFYNEYYWNNSSLTGLLMPAVCWFIFGAWVICMEIMCSSAMSSSNSGLVFFLAVFAIVYLAGTFGKIKEYIPTSLTGGVSFINGQKQFVDMLPSMAVTGITAVLFIAFGIGIFRKKQL